ncbi:MAG: hypothetical protein IJF54_01875 [Clostridia bacterium]|nr:hypothetical protein [Clostridia bacterium]
MADERMNSAFNDCTDAVCIDAGRVYDSCMDRDCLEDLRVYFDDNGQDAIQNAISCRVKCAEVANVKIDVEPVTFNRGFYSCDLTFYFVIKCEVVTASCKCPEDIVGLATTTKKVILCGSEGSVKTFSSTTRVCDDDLQSKPSSNLPKCVVQCVDPVILDSKICELCRCCDARSLFPCDVLRNLNGNLCTGGSKALYITLGLFSIVQLIRNVQMLVPVYDFCVPHKECHTASDNPCELFNKIDFPTEEFFPSADICNDRCCCD